MLGTCRKHKSYRDIVTPHTYGIWSVDTSDSRDVVIQLCHLARPHSSLRTRHSVEKSGPETARQTSWAGDSCLNPALAGTMSILRTPGSARSDVIKQTS